VHSFRRRLSYVENIVTPDEDRPQCPVGLAVLKLFGVGKLKVHVAVRADEEPLVFEPPFEAHEHRFPGQLLEERLRVDG